MGERGACEEEEGVIDRRARSTAGGKQRVMGSRKGRGIKMAKADADHAVGGRVGGQVGSS